MNMAMMSLSAVPHLRSRRSLERPPHPSRPGARHLAVAALLGVAALAGTATPVIAAPPAADEPPAPPPPASPPVDAAAWMLSSEGTELTGERPSVRLDVAIPPGWEPTGPALLSLTYSVGALTSGTISITRSGESLGVVEVAAPGGTVDIAIPAEHLDTGQNSIRLTANLALTIDDECRDPSHPERRLTLSPATSLRLPLAPTGPLDVDDFPAALEPVGSVERSVDVHLVGPLTEQITSATTHLIQSLRDDIDDIAVDVATVDAGTFSLDALSSERPSIVVGLRADIGADASDGATITRAPSGQPLLMITGDDGDAVADAALQLAEDEPSQTVTDNDTETYSLADLGYDDRSLEGPGTDSTLYGFDLPINAVPDRISLRVDARSSSGASSLDSVGVVVNGQRIGVARFGDIGRTVDNTLEADRSVLRPGRNLVRLEADFDARSSGCSGTPTPQTVDIIADSTTFEQGTPGDTVDLDLEDLPFVFRAPTDADALTLVLPERATDDEIGRAIDIALLLGSDGHPAAVIDASDLDDQRLHDDHLVVIGEPTRQPTFDRLSAIPGSELDDRDLFGLQEGDVGGSATAGDDTGAVIRFVPTPAPSERLIMVITGDDDAHVTAAMDAMLDIEQRGEFEGASISLVAPADDPTAISISTQTEAFSQTLRAAPVADTFATGDSSASSSSSSSSSSTAPASTITEADRANGVSSQGMRTWTFVGLGLALALAAGLAVRHRQSQANHAEATTH